MQLSLISFFNKDGAVKFLFRTYCTTEVFISVCVFGPPIRTLVYENAAYWSAVQALKKERNLHSLSPKGECFANYFKHSCFIFKARFCDHRKVELRRRFLITTFLGRNCL